MESEEVVGWKMLDNSQPKPQPNCNRRSAKSLVATFAIGFLCRSHDALECLGLEGDGNMSLLFQWTSRVTTGLLQPLSPTKHGTGPVRCDIQLHNAA